MVRKYGVELEICLIEGELGERADAEGRRSRHRGRRTDGRRGGLTRRVGGSDCRCFLHCLSVCAARHLLSLLEVAVKLFESRPGDNSALGIPRLPRTRLSSASASIQSHHGRRCSTSASAAKSTQRQSPAFLRPLQTPKVRAR